MIDPLQNPFNPASKAAERNDALEAAALACEAKAAEYLDPAYTGSNPMASFAERFACKQCAAAIRRMKTP
jgi:hypothetical protein